MHEPQPAAWRMHRFRFRYITRMTWYYHTLHKFWGEKGFQRQKTTGAALPKHKPVAIIRRSRPLKYIQMDVFQLDERPLKTMVTYLAGGVAAGRR